MSSNTPQDINGNPPSTNMTANVKFSFYSKIDGKFLNSEDLETRVKDTHLNQEDYQQNVEMEPIDKEKLIKDTAINYCLEPNEKILYSRELIKINKNGVRQRRII